MEALQRLGIDYLLPRYSELVRLEARLGFRISIETLRLVRLALAEGVFDRLSGARLRDELVLLLDDPMTVEQSIDRLAERAGSADPAGAGR